MSLALGSAANVNLEELDSPSLESIQAELNNWQHIAFYGDMSGSSESNESSNDQNNRPPLSAPSSSTVASAHDDRTARNNAQQPLINNNPFLPPPLGPTPQIAPETYNYLIHALLALQRSAGHQHPQLHSGDHHPLPLGQQYSLAVPPTYGWPPLTAGPAVTSMAGQSPVGYSQVYHHNATNATPSFQIPPLQPTEASSSPPTSQPVAVPTQVVETEQTDENVSITEDKRRRNTAASARFRVKKKMKTLNLERTVADITGRTEELEREAADLRRENGWLKEIILLKSRSIGGLGPTESQSIRSGSFRELQEGNDDGSPTMERSSNQKGNGKDSG
ncbi:hypothetical protein EDD17DRAFT_1763362 [Pisolithus thermaeus]|nr:hypothetical protein EDD17DRAFT_1763362 [Pisolithus thermaeus]